MRERDEREELREWDEGEGEGLRERDEGEEREKG